MATLAERIERILRTSSHPMDDDELAGRIDVIRQAVNQACRRLEAQGLLRRDIGPNNKIVNSIVDDATRPGPASVDPVRPGSVPPSAGQPISEDDIKAAVRDFWQLEGCMSRSDGAATVA